MAELQEMPSAADVAAEDGERKVTSLELFFDLVFVFAITQVTAKMAAEPVWGGLVRGLLIVSLLWWAWVAYAWLTNTVDADEGGTRILVFAAMGAMFVVALAIPNAFGSDALLFALAYGAVRLLHIFLYERGAHDEGVEAAVRRLAPGVLLAMGLLIAASQFDGAVQGALWVAAVAVDYVGVVLAGTEGWKVSAGHFAERHGLIIIIALGESIVAIGVGVSGLPLDAGLIGASLLGLAVTCCLWWAYFDVVALVAERKLRQATGRDRAALARDSYSLLHLPMIAGIVLLAFGLKSTVGHVGGELAIVPAVALGAGPALYLGAHVAFRYRNVHTVNRQRVAAALLCLLVIPVASTLPAIAGLGLLAVIWIGLIGYEAVRFREARARIRAAG